MSPVLTHCPACTLRIRVPAEMLGRPVRCPRCRRQLPDPADTTLPVAVASPRTPRPTVFVSHAHEDRAFVRDTLQPLLHGHGLQAWWSEENIKGGERWQKMLRDGVAGADWFVVVLSPHAQVSQWVRNEVSWAFADRSHRIIPILLKPCVPDELDPRLPDLHFVDFSTDAANASRKLLADMMQKLHEQARDRFAQVEELSRQCEELKDSLNEAEERRLELTEQVQGVLGFDGTYTHVPARDVPPFVPLASRSAPIVTVLNLKGGVGKTTLTANLGAALWSRSPRRRVLLVDLDYQANLSLSCLGRDVLRRVGRQRRLVQELFRPDATDPMLALRCCEPISDDNRRATEGSILACDGGLSTAETQALMRWLVGDGLDLRYLLRAALHAPPVQEEFDLILLDCPPRLTPTCVNALTACDYLLVPALLDEKSTEGPPPLLKWIWDRRESLDLHVRGVGLLANKTKGSCRDDLVGREKEVWAGLEQQCRDRWTDGLRGFETVVPLFTEPAMARKFPACYAEMGGTFARLADELLSFLTVPAEVAP